MPDSLDFCRRAVLILGAAPVCAHFPGFIHRATGSPMKILSRTLHQDDRGTLRFWCVGCSTVHGVSGERWNGNAERPTFSGDITVRSGDVICHSTVTSGWIRFLEDTTHLRAGQAMPLPEWSE